MIPTLKKKGCVHRAPRWIKSKSFKSQPLGLSRSNMTQIMKEQHSQTSTQKWPRKSHLNAMQMLYVFFFFLNAALQRWRAKVGMHVNRLHSRTGSESRRVWGPQEWRGRTELFNVASFAWEASGWCSSPTYAIQTDRQDDSYEDRWMMQRLRHWGKEWDQMLTVRWTDPCSGLQMFSHICYHMVSEGIQHLFLDETRFYFAISKSFYFFFSTFPFFPPPSFCSTVRAV